MALPKEDLIAAAAPSEVTTVATPEPTSVPATPSATTESATASTNPLDAVQPALDNAGKVIGDTTAAATSTAQDWGTQFMGWAKDLVGDNGIWGVLGLAGIGLIGWILGNAFGGGGLLGLIIGAMLTIGFIAMGGGKSFGNTLESLFGGDTPSGQREANASVTISPKIQPEQPLKSSEISIEPASASPNQEVLDQAKAAASNIQLDSSLTPSLLPFAARKQAAELAPILA